MKLLECPTCRQKFKQGKPFKNNIVKNLIEKIKIECNF